MHTATLATPPFFLRALSGTTERASTKNGIFSRNSDLPRKGEKLRCSSPEPSFLGTAVKSELLDKEEGAAEGKTEGRALGRVVGVTVGEVGCDVGWGVGTKVGKVVGKKEGAELGATLGS
jgi:hypothetical protein